MLDLINLEFCNFIHLVAFSDFSVRLLLPFRAFKDEVDNNEYDQSQHKEKLAQEVNRSYEDFDCVKVHKGVNAREDECIWKSKFSVEFKLNCFDFKPIESMMPNTLKIFPSSLAGIVFETILLIAMAFVDTKISIVVPA